MKNLKNIIIIICMVVTFIAWIYYYSSYKNVKDQLTNAEQEIENLQSSLDDESAKLEDANAENVKIKGELSNANEIIAAREGEVYFVDCEVTEREIDMIAKTVWGEARGCSKLEQSAVVWCILNRVDAGRGSIAEVITAPNQFHGYSSSFPVTDEIKALVKDVIARWKLEKTICGDVGRTLPSNYLYFSADDTGIGNIFRTSWEGGDRWNWDCWNPYS
jgi:hypothetical protein